MTAMTLIAKNPRLNITKNYSVSKHNIVMYTLVPSCTHFITLDTECAQSKSDC